MFQRQNKITYYRKVDFVFYHEDEIRQAVLDAREDAMEISPRNGSGISDPTAYEAVRNLSPIPFVLVEGVKLEHPELWLTVIDETYAWCKRQGGLYYEIARLRYSGEFYRSICDKLLISENAFYQTFREVRVYAALVAAQFHLIFVVPVPLISVTQPRNS